MISRIIRQVEEKPAVAILIGVSVLAGVAFARSVSSREEPGRFADTLANSAREGLETARDGLETAGKIATRLKNEGAEQLDRGVDRIQSMPTPSLPEAPALPSLRQPPPKRALSKMGIEEKTVAVFMGTLLAKSVSGYLRWSSEQSARAKGAAIAVDELNGEDSLEEQTVVELRRQASEHEIEGRSSMNKDELVDALKTV